MRRRRAQGRGAGLLLLALAWALPAAARPDNAALAEAYVALAFGPPAASEPPALWREGPVRVALVGEPGRGFKAHYALRVLLARLAELTGLALEPVVGEEAEIVLVYVTEPARDLLGPQAALAEPIFPERAERERQLGAVRGSGCSSWFAHREGPPARMTRVLGAIRRGQAADGQWACMVDLLVRAMGFQQNRIPGDWTMLSSQGPWIEPTEEDRLLLRLLYAPALAEEEDSAAARATALRLLEAWRP